MSTHITQPDLAPRPLCPRNGSRYSIDAPCRFWWTAPTEQPHFGAGRISNLSVAGAAIDSPILPHIGSTIMLEIDLPRSSHVGQASNSCLVLAAEGKVLRHHPAGSGFAAHITHAAFAHNMSSTPQ